MKLIIEKAKQAVPAVLFGWLLTIWLPVPGHVRRTVDTAVNAVVSGVRAAVGTVQTAKVNGADKNT